ncbi:MAG: carbohydrate ABC transporter permease [Anaerolineae bacterium]
MQQTTVPTTSMSVHSKFTLRRSLDQMPRFILLSLLCLATIFPIYWMVVTAVRPVDYSLQYPPALFPQEIGFAPFEKLFENLPIIRWLLNSAFVSIITTVLCLGLTVIGAFTMSILRWRGQTIFGFMLLMTQMLPEVLIVIPLFTTYQRLGLKESIPALALIDVAFVLPLGIWILKNLFDTIPKDIYDAALVDGCSPLGVLWRVLLPLVAPGLVAVGVVAFFHAWNEYLFSASLLTNRNLWTASVGLASLRSMLDTPIDRVLAAGLLFSIFPVIFYLSIQRYVVAGLSAGAVKG